MNTLRDERVGTADAPAQTAVLRKAMVQVLRTMGVIRSEPVAQAMATVPRHMFAPGEPLEQSYAAKTIL